jgi:hypothetical protein
MIELLNVHRSRNLLEPLDRIIEMGQQGECEWNSGRFYLVSSEPTRWSGMSSFYRL